MLTPCPPKPHLVVELAPAVVLALPLLLSLRHSRLCLSSNGGCARLIGCLQARQLLPRLFSRCTQGCCLIRC